jgi:hypothetical protein
MSSTASGLSEWLSAGGTPTREAAHALAEMRDLIRLGALATDVRHRRLGDRATFVRVWDVDVANGVTGASIDEAAGEIRMVNTPSSADDATRAVRGVAASAAGRTVTGFELHALETLAGSDSKLFALLETLRDAGLDAVSEACLDDLTSPRAALQAVCESGLRLVRLTMGRPLEAEALIDRLLTIRDLQADTGVIESVAPLARGSSGDTPTTGYDDMRTVAWARLLVDNVAHVQVDWQRSGPKLAQAALLFGADDIDNVPARDAEDLGPRRAAVEEVLRNIRAASLSPVERDGLFEVLGR